MLYKHVEDIVTDHFFFGKWVFSKNSSLYSR